MPRPKKSTSLSEVLKHYNDGKAELETRITHKTRGFDVYDRVFRNFIDPKTWPFRALVPDGRGSTLLKRKTDRLLSSPLKGRLVPRKSGSELKAKIHTELILAQWQSHDLLSDEPIIKKWRKQDLSTRKYGTGFGFVGWNKKGKKINQPWFEHIENRDVITQPGARSIEDSEWVQVRRYVTASDLKEVNEKARFGKIYDEKAIQELEENDGKDQREYVSVNKEVIGLSNAGQKGRFEIVTEYRRDKWITFMPKRGKDDKDVLLREIDNPFEDDEIHIIPLTYDSIDDDFYGVPELEAVMPLIKASWALICQYLESAQNELYTPLMVNPQNVQMDTLKFDSGARWLMQRPGQDVMPFQIGTTSMQKFFEVYGLLTSLIMEGIGETGQDVSQMAQQVGAEKTATEVKDMAMLRTSRDNANKLMLKLAIGRMVGFWVKMNQKFLPDKQVIQIVGKDALQYFIDEGLHTHTLSAEGAEAVARYASEHDLPWEQSYDEMAAQGILSSYLTPLFPVTNADGEIVPKLQLSDDEKSGYLLAEKSDLEGEFDFLVDIEAMGVESEQSDGQMLNLFLQNIEKVSDKMQQQGYDVKWKELTGDIASKLGVKDPDKYFQKVDPLMQQNGNLQNAGTAPGANGPAPGVAGPPPGPGPQGQGIPPVGVPPQVFAPVPGAGAPGGVPGPIPGRMA